MGKPVVPDTANKHMPQATDTMGHHIEDSAETRQGGPRGDDHLDCAKLDMEEERLNGEIRALEIENAILDLQKKIHKQREFIHIWEAEFSEEGPLKSKEKSEVQRAYKTLEELEGKVEDMREARLVNLGSC